MATKFVDSVIAYRILRMLVTPFEETDAYRLGIINNTGKELKRMSSLNTIEEREAYTILHRMIFRLKRIIEKVPLENKKLLSFAAALSLIKENINSPSEIINLEERFLDKHQQDLTEEKIIVEAFINNKQLLTFRLFMEEVPANNAS
ncbi:MAG: hypothetical protein ACO3UU_12045, partial [Minisyncoccia bacterium]